MPAGQPKAKARGSLGQFLFPEGQLVARASILPLGRYRRAPGEESVSLAFPSLVGEALSAPRRAIEGARLATLTGDPEYAVGPAADLAGLLGTGGVGMTGASAVRAAGRAGTSAGRAVAKAHREAPTVGVFGGQEAFEPPAKGWFFDASGKRSFEIPDFEATLKKGTFSTGTTGSDPLVYKGPLEGILNHPELYRQYPELADVPVEIRWNPLGKRDVDASFHPGLGRLITMEVGGPEEVVVASLLHEINHALQDIEDFARGGNVNEFFYHLSPLISKAGLPELSLDTAHALYRQLAGEVASRNVEHRFLNKISPELLPPMTEPNPRWEQIVVPQRENLRLEHIPLILLKEYGLEGLLPEAGLAAAKAPPPRPSFGKRGTKP